VGDAVVTLEAPGTLAALYRAQHAPMVRLAHLLTGSNAAAEELVHDAFIRLHGRFDEIDNPAGYLRTTVVNGCRSWHRRRLLERRHATVADPPPVLPPDVDETWRALAALPVRRRAAIVLRYYEDLPDEEIARLLDCRPATVRSLVHRGLATLKEALEP
jgi:RNA polymerase sigma-70 factor (sigma-E family)